MLLLMNRDDIIAGFEKEKSSYVLRFEKKERMPIGFQTLENWLKRRNGGSHNGYLYSLMKKCHCDEEKEFLSLTHAVSLNDTFWVKNKTESLCWNDVSPYQNYFSEPISKLAFEGTGDFEEAVINSDSKACFPELTTEGSFRKCWKKENGKIFLYKQGESGARNVGLEPYSEILGAELAQKICPEAVFYTQAELYGKTASKCQLFTSEQYGYVPMFHFRPNGASVNDLIHFYQNIESENAFRRMLVLDALTFQVDRHMGNFGVLVDNSSLKILKMAPVFDLNLSCLPYVEQEEISKIGQKLLDYGPRIGNDFLRTGQEVMTSEIRADLINLTGFEFTFRGDEKFSPERVKWLEQLINRQLHGLLRQEVLYTKDIFIP